ncbi:MAG: glutamate--tRNA ligase [Acidimicrobiales bacterium]|nr:glutamate--tRNA ligase [Acidimicrobiales bacterium]
MPAPRVRFAPAPTGYLHVGSARSALFNWLYARSTGGTFVLRIEDTNAELAKPEFYAAITDPLEWLGIDWDEGPYYQSERTQLYLDAIDRLLASGQAYHCDCSREAIDERNRAAKRSGYDGFCRDRGIDAGADTVVRFRTPDDGQTLVADLVRGDVLFENAELEDFVIRRSNGSPVFLVANAVDDADMGITHAVRGEDLLNTTPKVLLLWRALELGPEPTYAHLPLLVGADRKKLSKRKDSVALSDFRDEGFLPEAMVNYLALLGWSTGDDQEILSVDELIARFDLADVNKAPAFFDMTKLEHINGLYLRALTPSEFAARAMPYVTAADVPWAAADFDPARFEAFVPLIQEKVSKLSEVPGAVDFLFVADPPFDDASWEKVMVKGPQPAELLDGAAEVLADCEWSTDAVKDAVFAMGEGLGVNKSKTQAPVRVALTGRTVGPPLFDAIANHFTREETLRRIARARAAL